MNVNTWLFHFSTCLNGRSISEHPELCGRIPISHFWDQNEPRLFVCEAILNPSQQSADTKQQQVTESLVCLFPILLLWHGYPRDLLSLCWQYVQYRCFVSLVNWKIILNSLKLLTEEESHPVNTFCNNEQLKCDLAVALNACWGWRSTQGRIHRQPASVPGFISSILVETIPSSICKLLGAIASAHV